MSATFDHLGDMLSEQNLAESRAAARYVCDIDPGDKVCWSTDSMEQAFRAGIAWHRKMLHTKAVNVTFGDTKALREAVRKVRDNTAGLGQTLNVSEDQIIEIMRPFAADGGRWPSSWVNAAKAVLALVAPEVRHPDITSSNVTVDRAYHWLPMHTCPVNSKVQLLTIGGLPQYGWWDGKDDFYVGWAPIPTRSPEHVQQGFA